MVLNFKPLSQTIFNNIELDFFSIQGLIFFNIGSSGQVSNPSGAQLWVLSGRSTVETCASNKSWIQLSCIVS